MENLPTNTPVVPPHTPVQPVEPIPVEVHRINLMNWFLPGVGAVVLIVFVIAGIVFFRRSQSDRINIATVTPSPIITEGVACTREAKLCPDGSSVGRTGPNCEFAPCPTPTVVVFTPVPTTTPPPLNSPIVVPSTWQRQSANYYDKKLTISLKTPENYKLIESGPNILIQQQYPPNVVVTSEDPSDYLSFNDIAYATYDGSSRRDFYRRFLNGETEGFATTKATILSVTEHPLTNNSYLKFITKNETEPNTVHFITVKNGSLIVFQSEESSTSVLQQNIDKILDTLEVTKG